MYKIHFVLRLFCVLQLFLIMDGCGGRDQSKQSQNQVSGSAVVSQSYRSETYGFSIKYPDDWIVVEAALQDSIPVETVREHEVLNDQERFKVTFFEKTYSMWQGQFQIRVLDNPDSFALNQWIVNYKRETITGDDLIQSRSDTTIHNRPAKGLSIFAFDHEEKELVLLDKGLVYCMRFAGSNPNDDEIEEHARIYREMVASFIFH